MRTRSKTAMHAPLHLERGHLARFQKKLAGRPRPSGCLVCNFRDAQAPESKNGEAFFSCGERESGIGCVECAVFGLFPRGEQGGSKLQRVCCSESVNLQ